MTGKAVAGFAVARLDVEVLAWAWGIGSHDTHRTGLYSFAQEKADIHQSPKLSGDGVYLSIFRVLGEKAVVFAVLFLQPHIR